MPWARVICALSLLCSVDALAAKPDNTAHSHVVAHAKRKRTVGIILTSVGAGLGATGAGLAIYGAVVPVPEPTHTMGPAIAVFGGIGLGLTSLPFLGAGIPLWVIGNHQMHAASVGLYRSGDETRVVFAGRW